MSQLSNDELKKLTKAELIDHIEDIEGILEYHTRYKHKFENMRNFCTSGIWMNQSMLQNGPATNEMESAYAVVQLRTYKKMMVYMDHLESNKTDNQ